MASPREIEVTIYSAKDLKNVNWRHGPIRPYAVLWVDPKYKCSSKVDEEGDTSPFWDETLLIPLPPAPINDDTALFVDVVHGGSEEDTKPLIGSAKIKLREVLDNVGFGVSLEKTLKLKRPSGRPHGKADVRVLIREPRYHVPDPYRAPPYGVPPPASRDYLAAPPAYGYSYQYAQPPPPQNPYYAAPASGQYSYNAQPAYGEGSGGGYYGYGQEEKKKSKFGGMGTGLAVGAVAGALGGLALAEGVDALEDHFEDEVAEKVEDDIGYDDGGDDF
ncbi:BAHD acyltransferase DCR-like [Hibiscus syriacus]|uniref:BAHD acyltransferase DCR-like n=1 Tax=Hibiscus syriacus TaxID=106335 RepID=A0A6A3BT98_HIBSY|nr:protein SRC2-like [Hibiscus syriacus]KAE8719725.1 BAHD acyltransferase DCR-like [Hibiscus syriacus]